MFKKLLLVFAATFSLAFLTYALFGGLLFIPRNNPTSAEATILVAAVAALIATMVAAGAFLQKDTTEHAFDFLGEGSTALRSAISAIRLTFRPNYLRLGLFYTAFLLGLALFVAGSVYNVFPLLLAVFLWWGRRTEGFAMADAQNELRPTDRKGLKGLMLLASALIVVALFLVVNTLGSSARVLDVIPLLAFLFTGMLVLMLYRLYRNRSGGFAQFQFFHGLAIAGYGLLLLMAVNCYLDPRESVAALEVTRGECDGAATPSPLQEKKSGHAAEATSEGCAKLLSLGRFNDQGEIMRVSDYPGLLGMRWRRFDPWR